MRLSQTSSQTAFSCGHRCSTYRVERGARGPESPAQGQSPRARPRPVDSGRSTTSRAAGALRPETGGAHGGVAARSAAEAASGPKGQRAPLGPLAQFPRQRQVSGAPRRGARGLACSLALLQPTGSGAGQRRFAVRRAGHRLHPRPPSAVRGAAPRPPPSACPARPTRAAACSRPRGGGGLPPAGLASGEQHRCLQSLPRAPLLAERFADTPASRWPWRVGGRASACPHCPDECRTSVPTM